MDLFLKNPGLFHLAENIFAKLDAVSSARCRLVSKSWRDFIDNSKSLSKAELDRILNFRITSEKSTIFQAYPKWIKVFEFIKRRKNSEDISLFLGSMKRYLQCFKLQKNLYMDPLQFAITQNIFKVHEFLNLVLKSGYEFAQKEGNNLFRFGLTQENCKVLKILFEHSEELSIDLKTTLRWGPSISDDGSNILHVACRRRNVELIQMIMKKPNSIDFNAINRRGQTPFFIACLFNFVEGIKTFLDNAEKFGIDLNAIDNSWICTPFDIAVKNGHLEIVEILLDASKERNLNIQGNFQDAFGLLDKLEKL